MKTYGNKRWKSTQINLKNQMENEINDNSDQKNNDEPDLKKQNKQ